VKKLYKINVEDNGSISSKAEKVQSHNLSEICHIRLGHLHHGALNIMKQITTSLRKGELEQQDVFRGCTFR